MDNKTMDNKTKFKRVLGSILALLILPVIFGLIGDPSFKEGFLLGIITDLGLIILLSIIILILWLFGMFE